MSVRIVFMGTPEFAVPSLHSLVEAGFDVVAAYTQPDRPSGRGHKLMHSAVKRAASAAGIPVHQPRTLKDEASLATLRRLAPDIIVVVAFGQLLPKAVLQLPPLGCINVHASLLPRHRGAAPIQAALAAGDAVTGVTTMFMDEGLDTGDIILRREVPIDEDDNAGTLHDKLARTGAELLVETIKLLADGAAPRIPQDDRRATYARRLTKDDARIVWDRDVHSVVNQIRAFAPRPGAFVFHRGRLVKLLDARVWSIDENRRSASSDGGLAPGTVVEISADGFVVHTRAGRLLVTKVQPAGRGPMSGRDYSNGFRLQVGETFDSESTAG